MGGSSGGRAAIVVMAKAPRPGEVKTRLSPALSPIDAAALSRCFLLDTVALARRLDRVVIAIAYTPSDARIVFEETCPGVFLVPQWGDDLGARLAGAFEQLFALGFASVVAIGADTPTLPLAYLETALALVRDPRVDVVLGPSTDGGYYLIGMRALQHGLFQDIPWSTGRVFAETLRRTERAGITTACLASWRDVDTVEDLRALEAALRGGDGGTARETRRFLAARAGGFR